MIKHKDLWLYGFWQRSELKNEYIVYGINKNILLLGILIQTLLLTGFLTLLFRFEGMWYLSPILVISTILFINKIQRNIFWFNYNADSRKLIVLSSGFRTPDAIKGRFTMGKKGLSEKVGL